jgi:hypothetical protein
MFFAHDSKNENGFGGNSFVLPMRDGTTRVIKGPWSSREGVLHQFGMPHCVPVEFDLVRHFVRLDVLKPIASKYNIGFEVEWPLGENDGPYYKVR